MHAIRAAIVSTLLVGLILAGCRFIVPADDGSLPPLPEPGFSGAPFPSPSLEIPPPVY